MRKSGGLLREATNWIECDRQVAIDNAGKIGSKLPEARLRIYETIIAALSTPEAIEGLDEAIAYYRDNVTFGAKDILMGDPLTVSTLRLYQAARLYAQGRTQG